jgi:hypothetical protein
MPASLATTKLIEADKLVKKIKEHTDLKVKIVDTDELPEGIIPTAINSDAELFNYLEAIEHDDKNLEKFANEVTIIGDEPTITDEFSIMSISTGARSKSFSYCLGTHSVVMRVYYHYDTSTMTFTTCDNITSYNTGWTVDSQWEQLNSDYWFTSSNKQLNCQIEGLMRHYLLVNGLNIEVSSELRTHTAAWAFS